MDLLIVAFGLGALLMGGGWLVTGAVAVAARAGLSPAVIGVTLVGMGTSAPELLTSLRAALGGAPDIALGNVVGSNVANLALILGVSALAAPILFPRSTWRRDGLTLLAISTLSALWVGLAGGLGRVGGAAFVTAFAIWMGWQLRGGAPTEEAPDASAGRRVWAMLGTGLAGVLIGAEALVRGAVGLAEAAGVSQAVIGLTIVAVGTSLPELATSVVATRRGRGDLALGNLLGSNVFNLLAILGATALVAPLAAAPRFAAVDLPVMVATVAVVLALALAGRIGRVAGAVLLAGYAAYVALML
jgi:cation:H+ antiporter